MAIRTILKEPGDFEIRVLERLEETPSDGLIEITGEYVLSVRTLNELTKEFDNLKFQNDDDVEDPHTIKKVVIVKKIV